MSPVPMFCSGCGTERTVDVASADPGPCPRCGSWTRTSQPPRQPQSLLGVVSPIGSTISGGVVVPISPNSAR